MPALEAPCFNLEDYSADFFADIAAQLSDIDVAQQAPLVLADILIVTQADGSERTARQIAAETERFFASDWVQADEALFNQMAVQFAQACMQHQHGAELAGSNQLSSIFDIGIDSLHGSRDNHDHDHNKINKVEKKLTAKKKKRFSWFDWALTKS